MMIDFSLLNVCEIYDIISIGDVLTLNHVGIIGIVLGKSCNDFFYKIQDNERYCSVKTFCNDKTYVDWLINHSTKKDFGLIK
mgnify:CR=1 FL=1